MDAYLQGLYDIVNHCYYRDRDTEIERERQTDRQRQRHRETKKEQQRNRKTETERSIQPYRKQTAGKETERQVAKHDLINRFF